MSTLAPIVTLSYAQAETLLEWSEKTQESEWYEYADVFPGRDNQDNGKRRTMRKLMELGLIRSENGKISGGNPLYPQCTKLPNSPRYLQLKR